MSVYNGESKLSESVHSVLQQEYSDLELILVDDGSSDSSGQIADALANNDARLKVLHQDNAGLTRALIRGCAAASGRFIARHDVGDVSSPTRIAKQAAALERNPGWSFVACQWLLVGPEGEELVGPCPADGGLKIVEGLRSGLPHQLAGPHHGSVMMRRSAYEATGGYRSEFYFAQDLDLWTRLIEVGELGFVEDVAYRASFTAHCISANHRNNQEALKWLISEATRLRRSGQSEATVLQKATEIRPVPGIAMNSGVADYFIGSCLLQRSDPRARDYLLRAAASRPINLKAWAKLARLLLSRQSSWKNTT
jgi:glycosyltransferase involved in cell wall biosynthesis